jgi:hypothetical protein
MRIQQQKSGIYIENKNVNRFEKTMHDEELSDEKQKVMFI